METWKDILEYEGLYQVSNYGNVKSLKRTVKSRFKTRTVRERNLKLGKRGQYRTVTLSKNDNQKTFSVHRLVAMAFVPNLKGENEVNHIDENPENNNFSNLEWVSHKENLHHTWERSPHKKNHWSKSGGNKLTPEQVLKIIEIGRSLKQREIAQKFGVVRQTVSKILNGETFKGIAKIEGEVP